MSELGSLSELAVAYHEAGHAVVAHALGRPFDYVTIIPDEDQGSLGHTHSTRPRTVRHLLDCGACSVADVRFAEDDITHSLAGGLAQGLVCEVDEACLGSDERSAWELANAICGDEEQIKACIAWCRHRAELILRDERVILFLDTLAHCLLEHKRISYGQAISIYEQALAQVGLSA